MNKIFKYIEKLYTRFYQWLLLGLVILIIYYFFSYDCFFIDKTYLQTIFVGLTAFGIPFMWNAHQRIIEIKSQSVGDKIENILSKQYYQKANKYFEAFLLFPTAIFLLVGLIISPLLPPAIILCLMIASSVFFILQPRIFSWIETISATSLLNYIIQKDPTDPDLLKVFREIWLKNDVVIDKELSITPIHLLNIFADKIDNLINHE